MTTTQHLVGAEHQPIGTQASHPYSMCQQRGCHDHVGTVAELIRKLSLHPDFLDVTIVTPDGVHHNIESVEFGSDNEGDPVICLSVQTS